MTAEGHIIVTARRFRTREANRADARLRLAEMVAAALVAPIRRRPTKPSKAARARRVEGKALRGVVKRARAGPRSNERLRSRCRRGQA